MSTLKVNTIRHTGASSDAVTLATDGTCTAKITNNLSNRNLIINGGFDIWQRATDSGSNTTDGYLAADRWRLNSSGATKQVTRQAFDLAQTDVPGYPKYYLRFAVTTGNNNVGLTQRIEDVRRVQGEVTLSFWAKGTNPNGGTFGITNRQDFGSGGSSVVDTGYGTFTVSNTWAKKTFTFTPPSISGKTIGSSSYYSVNVFRQPAGDTSTNAYTIDIANVQLEFGGVATDFEKLSYGDELKRCGRYYQQLVDGNTKALCIVFNWNSTQSQAVLTHPMGPMRATPSLEAVTGSNYWAAEGGTAGSPRYNDGAFSIEQGSPTQSYFYCTLDVSGTGGESHFFGSKNAACKFAFSAEL